MTWLANNSVSITPSDTVNIAGNAPNGQCIGIVATTGGVVALVLQDDTVVPVLIVTNIPYFGIAFKRVNSTGTGGGVAGLRGLRFV